MQRAWPAPPRRLPSAPPVGLLRRRVREGGRARLGADDRAGALPGHCESLKALAPAPSGSPVSSRPGARSALTRVAAHPRERQQGALARRRGSRRRASTPATPAIATKEGSRVADHNAGPSRAWSAHLWREAGRSPPIFTALLSRPHRHRSDANPGSARADRPQRNRRPAARHQRWSEAVNAVGGEGRRAVCGRTGCVDRWGTLGNRMTVGSAARPGGPRLPTTLRLAARAPMRNARRRRLHLP